MKMTGVLEVIETTCRVHKLHISPVAKRLIAARASLEKTPEQIVDVLKRELGLCQPTA